MALDDLVAGVAELTGALPGYQLAEEFYEGTRPEVFADRRMRRLLESTGVNYRINFANTPVDTRVDRLEIAAIKCADTAAQDALEKMREAQGLDLEEYEAVLRGCEFGDAYIMVWPDDDGDGDAETVNFMYMDPRTVRIIYDDENPNRKLFTVMLWPIGKKHRATLYYDDHIERWVTKADGDDPVNPANWIPYAEYDERDELIDSVQPNPYGRQPFFHLRTSRPFGTPCHKPAYGPQDIINKLVITHMTTIDYAGAPQRYALSGNDMDDGDGDAEDFDFVDAAEAIPHDRREDAQSTMRSEPGSMWFLKNVKSVGQFDPASPATFLEPFVMYLRMMAQTSTTPLHYFDPSGGLPSGESLRVAEAPLIKAVRRLARVYGAALESAYAFALELLGFPNQVVTISWVPPQSRDDQAAWNLSESKRNMGVPPREIFNDLGYTDDQLNQWQVPTIEEEGWSKPEPVLEPQALPKRLVIGT